MSEKKRFVVLASVHEGGKALNLTKTIQKDLRRVYRSHFGARTSVTCIWMEIPTGQAFIAGHPSTASTVLAPVPDEIAQPDREQFMRDICDVFRERTACSVNEIIVTAMNVTDAKRYSKMARQRFDKKKSKRTVFKIATHTLFARLSSGYLKTSLNIPN